MEVFHVCRTWEGFGAWFGGKASGPDHLHLQLAFLIHQTNLDITCLCDTWEHQLRQLKTFNKETL